MAREAERGFALRLGSWEDTLAVGLCLMLSFLSHSIRSMSDDRSMSAKRRGEEAVAEGKRQRVAVVECGCDARVLAAFPDYASEVPTSRCACTSRRLAAAVQRHHFKAREDGEGRSPPDVQAANRFATYGALNAIIWSNKKGAAFSFLLPFPSPTRLPPLLRSISHSLQ